MTSGEEAAESKEMGCSLVRDESAWDKKRNDTTLGTSNVKNRTYTGGKKARKTVLKG